MYSSGEAVKRDDKSAFKWMKLAAEHEQMIAARTVLGVMYWRGWGTEPNTIRAYMWLSIAMSAGDKVANEMKAKLEKKMTPSQLEVAQQLALECVAKDYKGC
ncbi:MAG: sel1 repeat family protein [Gammaproteobacteria bacterium]|nr:sel1 repeat family protein [Gammaproteobacteria bacterium]